ncbi:MAG: hypothetical protein HY815_14805, partial [Candidatus Riflebacteria bacterium]|nr:hypothetical protein [Candidatus Riflebacteria bacterium]
TALELAGELERLRAGVGSARPGDHRPRTGAFAAGGEGRRLPSIPRGIAARDGSVSTPAAPAPSRAPLLAAAVVVVALGSAAWWSGRSLVGPPDRGGASAAGPAPSVLGAAPVDFSEVRTLVERFDRTYRPPTDPGSSSWLVRGESRIPPNQKELATIVVPLVDAFARVLEASELSGRSCRCWLDAEYWGATVVDSVRRFAPVAKQNHLATLLLGKLQKLLSKPGAPPCRRAFDLSVSSQIDCLLHPEAECGARRAARLTEAAALLERPMAEEPAHKATYARNRLRWLRDASDMLNIALENPLSSNIASMRKALLSAQLQSLSLGDDFLASPASWVMSVDRRRSYVLVLLRACREHCDLDDATPEQKRRALAQAALLLEWVSEACEGDEDRETAARTVEALRAAARRLGVPADRLELPRPSPVPRRPPAARDPRAGGP